MSHESNLRIGLETRVFWITKRIALGQFATPERALFLRNQGVTHVLNVGEGTSVVSTETHGFREVRDCPVVDLQRIRDDVALTAIDSLHAMLTAKDSRVFVHCVAGQNRSPTILWLYFLACGLSSADAKDLITSRSPDSVPGHKALVDARLVEFVRLHGAKNYLPLTDPSVLQPV